MSTTSTSSTGNWQMCPTCGLYYGGSHFCNNTGYTWTVPAPTTPPLNVYQHFTSPVRIAMREGAIMPTRATTKSVGLDLAIYEDISIPARGHKLAPTGLIIQPPDGYWIMIAGRSSLIKRGLILANGVGIVDPDYCGPDDEIMLSLFNVTDQVVNITAGSRLAQAIILEAHRQSVTQMEPDANANSRGGFGSTGV